MYKNKSKIVDMSKSTFRQMVPNLLCCGKCWGRITRALTMPKYLERLVNCCHGAYSHNYNAKAVNVLRDALDKEREKDYKRGFEEGVKHGK